MKTTLYAIPIILLALASCETSPTGDPSWEVFTPDLQKAIDSTYEANGIDPNTMNGISPLGLMYDSGNWLYLLGEDEDGNCLVNIYTDKMEKIYSKTFEGQDTLVTYDRGVLTLDKNNAGTREIFEIGDHRIFGWYQINEDDGGYRYVLNAFSFDKSDYSMSTKKFHNRSLNGPGIELGQRLGIWFKDYFVFSFNQYPGSVSICFDKEFNQLFSCYIPSIGPLNFEEIDYPLSVFEFISAGEKIVRFKFVDGGNLTEVWSVDTSLPDNWYLKKKDFILSDSLLTVQFTIVNGSDSTERTETYKVNIETGEAIQ